MSFLNSLKQCVPLRLKKSLKRFVGFQSMDTRLSNLRNAGFTCTGAVDVGAYHGEWTRSLRQVWNVPVIAVEPQYACGEVLKEYARKISDVPTYIEFCALGKEPGITEFVLGDTNSRLIESGSDQREETIQVQVSTLQEVIMGRDESFNLLKVDVQGRELDVLNGAADMLSQFEVVILEVSVIRIGPVPTFYEVIKYMDEKGYRLYDFLPMYYRPLDNALWQGDAFFVRNDSKLVASLNWH